MTCNDMARGPTLVELVEQLIMHERSVEVLRAALLARMEQETMKRVDVAGGHVIYVEASETTPVDVKACVEKLGKLGGELRALGRDPDDAVPLKTVTRRAGLRVNMR